MSALNDQIKENMRRLSDEALVKIIEVDFRDYSEEALACAKEELAKRRKIDAVKTPDVRPSEIDPVAPGGQATADSGPPHLKRTRFWGGFFLVLAAVIIYTAVLGVATIIVGTKQGMQASPDATFRIIFYAAITALCLWAGIKRRPRWELFLGITFSIIGVLAFFAHINLARVNSRSPIMGKASLITAVVLVAVGAVCFLLALVKRNETR
jgi:hypothetical protein